MLLAVTMLPAGGLSSAHADEAPGEQAAADTKPIGEGTEFAADGLRYVVRDGAAVLVGFEDGSSLEGALVVPETVSDGAGMATVKAVEVAEGQVADKVTALTLPQTVESVRTEGLATAFPALASIEVASGAAAEGDGDGAAGSEGGAAAKGAYSSAAGMLFRSAEGQASSDGEAFADDALELVWAPPAMVVARIPLECKAIAAGAFVDAAALETVMSFGKMESIASAEKDDEGNVTKPGAFADEQIGRLTIVVPGTNYAVTGEGAERVSGSVALSEKTDMLEKRKTWFHHGFDTSQIIMGAPFGEIEGVNAVSDEGVMEDRSLVTPLENGKSHLELTPEEAAEKAARRGEDPQAGLSFSYQASMDLSVRWAGDKTATPAHIDVPAYAKVDGVTYQVTQIEPNAFESAVFLSSVAIPEGVTSIGESAFAGCANLKSVSLPTTLKAIDYAAFKGTALESVDIPGSVRWVGGEAFADSPAEVQMRSAGWPSTDRQVVEENQPTPEDESVLASGEMSSYVASTTISAPINTPANLDNYSQPLPSLPLNYHYMGALLSPYYDIYYANTTHRLDSEGVHPAPASIVASGNKIDSTNNGKIAIGSYAGHGGRNSKIVQVGSKRCWFIELCYTYGVAAPEATAHYLGYVFVPKDNYYITGAYRYLAAGDYDYGSITTTQHGNLLTEAWAFWDVTSGYVYPTLAFENNLLSVADESSDSLSLVPQGTTSWTGSGTKAKAEDKFTVVPKAGYTLGEVTVTGEGTTYDAATNTLTMGWADSTVSAELIPNDINIQVALGPHGSSAALDVKAGTPYEGNVEMGDQQTSDSLGAYYDLKIGTEATKDNPGHSSADGSAMTNKATVSVVNTGSGTNKRSIVQFKTSEADGRKLGCEVSATSKNGWMQDYWKLVNVDTGAEVVLGAAGVDIDYTHQWRLVLAHSGADYGIAYDRNNSDVWTGPDTNQGSYNTATGFNNLPVPVRNGFWFAGWRWANSGDMDAEDTTGNAIGSWWNGTDDASARQFGIPAGAYGQANLVATWMPKVYQVNYDVNATEITEVVDGTTTTHNMATQPDVAYFIHPQARSVIAEGSGNAWTPLTWDSATDDQKGRIREVDLTYLDADGNTQDITSAQLDYTFAESTLEGFQYEGWTTSRISAGTTPSDSGLAGPWKHLFNDGSHDLNNESTIFGSYWTTDQVRPDGGYNDNNRATVYGVWSRVGEVTVTLGAEQPHEARKDGTVNDGEEITGGIVGVNQSIQYWQKRGLFVYGELLPANDPDHTTQTEFDQEALEAAIAEGKDVQLTESRLQFSDLKRTGFRFLGWGERGADGSPAKVYVRYLEGPDGSTAAGFYLTPDGMSHVLEWEAMPPTNAEGELAETWDALWEIRTYEITLHVPASTVKNTNGNGWSEASYRWEQDVQAGSDGVSTVSSWRKAKREWKYWDVFYVPYYELNSPFNTYRGWFRGSLGADGGFQFKDDDTFESGGQTYRKPVITEAQGQAQANGSLDSGEAAFRVTAANLDPKKLWDGAVAGQETDLDNVSAPDGSMELWLYAEPVFINVTAPMGVFLANDEPYVVGSDPRMALEEEATFTVKESNQDLVLTSITATDIVEADVNQTTNQVDVKTTTDDTQTTTGENVSRASGMCYQMFDVKNDVATDPAGGDQTKWNLDNARIFWVSPIETVNEYIKDTNQDPGQHDMGKRVYFGFGGGKKAANHLGDNVVEDDPDASDDGNLLDAFRLKQGYGTAGLAGKDGHKVATDAEGTSYVYDATRDQYGKTVGEGEEARTVWCTWAAKPGDANGRLVLTPVGGGADAHTVDVSRPIVWRDYSFWYGLDLDKCSFNLGAIQSMVEDESAWSYNVGYKKPLVKLMFTFAVERVPNVSYGAVGLSAYGDGEAEAAALATRAGTAGGDIDAEAIVSVGPASVA